MLTDAFAIAGQALISQTAGRGDAVGTNQTARRLMGWGLASGIGLAALFLFASPAMQQLVTDPATGVFVTDVGRVAGAWMPVAAPVFIADGIFLGLLAFGSLVMSTGAGAVVTIGLILATPLGDSLVGIWWALGAMMIARGAVLALAYPRAVAARS
jgi:Na+-driven multidrug efflux pump